MKTQDNQGTDRILRKLVDLNYERACALTPEHTEEIDLAIAAASRIAEAALLPESVRNEYQVAALREFDHWMDADKIREALNAGLQVCEHCKLNTTYHKRVLNEALAELNKFPRATVA